MVNETINNHQVTNKTTTGVFKGLQPANILRGTPNAAVVGLVMCHTSCILEWQGHDCLC